MLRSRRAALWWLSLCELTLRKFRTRQAAERLAIGAALVLGLVGVDEGCRPIRPEAYSDEFQRLA